MKVHHVNNYECTIVLKGKFIALKAYKKFIALTKLKILSFSLDKIHKFGASQIKRILKKEIGLIQ